MPTQFLAAAGKVQVHAGHGVGVRMQLRHAKHSTHEGAKLRVAIQGMQGRRDRNLVGGDAALRRGDFAVAWMLAGKRRVWRLEMDIVFADGVIRQMLMGFAITPRRVDRCCCEEVWQHQGPVLIQRVFAALKKHLALQRQILWADEIGQWPNHTSHGSRTAHVTAHKVQTGSGRMRLVGPMRNRWPELRYLVGHALPQIRA